MFGASRDAGRGLHKACDRCRLRKIRCDSADPCRSCMKAQAACSRSPRVQRARRSHSIRPDYQETLDSLGQRVHHMGRMIEILVTDANTTSSSQSKNSLPSGSSHGNEPSREVFAPSQQSPDQSSSPNNGVYGTSAENEPANLEREGHDVQVEGPSSLSAHSTFAAEYMHQVAGSDPDIAHLLRALRRIVDSVKKHSPEYAVGTSDTSISTPDHVCKLPPIEFSVSVTRKAHGSVILGFLNALLPLQSLSDLCLKVYFTQEYSKAEFIILNVTLYCLCGDEDSYPSTGSSNEYQSWYALNIEKTLGELPLLFNPTHDMVLALVLGSIYAVQASKPFFAWTLITTAHRVSHILGFHTRQRGAHELTGEPNSTGLLFWVIYYLEKFVSLRLGRVSTIPEIDITVPRPGATTSSPSMAMGYCGLAIRSASLAGRVYSDLYCPQAVNLPADQRRSKIKELSSEMQEILNLCHLHRENALKLTRDLDKRRFFEFVYSSDEVLQLSLLTLIHRAAPPPSGSMFTPECLSAARATLACHDALALDLEKGKPSLLAGYLTWAILFSPFVPFIVLFCHAIDTGSEDDIARMGGFVKSIESASHYSSALANHHRLFQVFHTVAKRYLEIKKSPALSSQPEMVDIRTSMNSYLGSLGVETRTDEVVIHTDRGRDASASAVSPYQAQLDYHNSQHQGDEQGLQLGNWFSLNQQMMDFLGSDPLPF